MFNIKVGWVTFKRTSWIDENGNKLYYATFREDHDLGRWTELTIRIWTKHIKKALRDICQKYTSTEKIEEELNDKVYQA